MWNLKRWYWLTCFQGSNGETDIENITMGKRGGEEGEGKMYGESNMEIYNTICKIDSPWEFAVWLRELKQGLCDRLKVGMRREMGGRIRRVGTWVYPWLILVDVWQKTTRFCKTIIFQLKIFLNAKWQNNFSVCREDIFKFCSVIFWHSIIKHGALYFLLYVSVYQKFSSFSKLVNY